MALPAGRYGVTKEQLRKIKRLPINTIGMITETKEGIAIIEDDAKASQLLIAGRQFWHNGKLYSADTDIAKDAAIITSGEGKNASEMPNITDQLPGTDAEKANEVTIARVENGSNPTATINAGEQFYHSGILYTATADIATTDTITPNTNCRVSDSVTEQIASLDAQKADNSVIGNVEDGANASQPYAVGEHFIRNGKFCTVTQAISSGDILTENTNYISGDVASILSYEDGQCTLPTSSPLANVTIDSSANSVMKYGKVCFVDVVIIVAEDTTTSAARNVVDLPFTARNLGAFDLRKNSAPFERITDFTFYLSSDGIHIRCNTINLLAGSYRISGSYLAK